MRGTDQECVDTSGNNPVYGTPRNPYCKDYYTGGSSSGCGYAVATGLIPVAVGSDGGGSIRIPSSWCGIYGLKPTHGRVSHKPGTNYSPTCSVNGPMAGDIRSLAALFEVIASPDPSSAFPPLSPFMIRPSSKRPKLLGISQVWFSRADPVVKQLCMRMIEKLKTEYDYKTIDIDIPFLVEGQNGHAMTVLTDAATLLPDTKNLTAANKIMLAIGQTTPSTDYLLAQKLRALHMQHLAHLWQLYPGMIIATPTTSCAGWRIQNKGEITHGINDGDTTIRSMEYVWMGNFCGVPGITVPVGYVVPEGRPGAGTEAGEDDEEKVPVGFMGMGEWADEHGLLEFGLDAEEAFGDARCRPGQWVDLIERAKAARK